MRKKLRLLGTILLCTMLLCGCKESEIQDLAENDLFFDEQIRDVEPILITDQYMYYVGVFHADVYGGKAAGRVLRLNVETGEVSSPCPDPLCTHDTIECPCFCTAAASHLRLFGDWLCIQNTFVGSFKMTILNSSNPNPYTRRIMLNLNTGEWFSVWDDQANAYSNTYEIFSNDECIYITTYGSGITDPETGEVYTPTVIRSVNLKTKEEKQIYSHKYYIKIGMVTQHRIYFYELLGNDTYSFYSVDLTGDDLREESQITVQPTVLYRDLIYGTGGNGSSYELLINHAETGEVIHTGIALTGSYWFDVTDEYLYYIQKADGYMELYAQAAAYTKEERQDPKIQATIQELYFQMNSMTSYLWRSNLNGNDPVMVCELGTVNTSSLRIEGDYCYIEDVFFDPETGIWYWGDHQPIDTSVASSQRICRINLNTGEKENFGAAWLE